MASMPCFLTRETSSEILRYDDGESNSIACNELLVWEASFSVYMEYVSMSNSLAVDKILVAISPL